MLVRRFCKCGVKLERDVADEETARKTIALFWREHCGALHGNISGKEYAEIIGGIIKRNYERKQSRKSYERDTSIFEAFTRPFSRIRDCTEAPEQTKSLGRANGEIRPID